MMVATTSGMLATSELTMEQFARIAEWLHAHAGIRMRAGKEGLVRSRLLRRLRALELTEFSEYLTLVENETDGREFAAMIDVLTTNKTSFLREAAHFDFVRDVVFPACTTPVRLWSAGCATGEEAYTLAMLAHETLSTQMARDARILATDISRRVLTTAKFGVYSSAAMHDVPGSWRSRHWSATTDGASESYSATPALRRSIQFARLNLMDAWPMEGPFDAIFCRNVMIFFDKATQQQLVERFRALLAPGGYLFVGHSESLTGFAHGFRYVQPAVYQK